MELELSPAEERVWEYAREMGLLYCGWASPPLTNYYHYFKAAESLCGRSVHFARSAPDKDLYWVPNHAKIPTCKTCLKRYNVMKKEMGK